MDETEGARRRQHALRVEQAARAAWLYYIGGRTQEEIAVQLNISRQGAQRLVSFALAEKLIKFRLDHPISACMELGERLAGRFGLGYCEIVPTDSGPDGPLPGLAMAGARYLERFLAEQAPQVIGMTHGRTLRAVAGEIAPMSVPQHKVISLCGTISASGRAVSTEPVFQVAERTGAHCYPLSTPVVAATGAERSFWQAQRPFQTLRALLEQARCIIAGVGHVGWRAPLHAAGFISDAELAALIEAGAVGEIASWAYDSNGTLIEGLTNDRVTSLSATWAHPDCIRLGIGAGPLKVAPFRAALRGRLLTALITDEDTAVAILESA